MLEVRGEVEEAGGRRREQVGGMQPLPRRVQLKSTRAPGLPMRETVNIFSL